MVSNRGIEINPDKIKAIEDITVVDNVKAGQRITGRIAALGWFISRSSDKSHWFFSLLKKKNNFSWIQECQQALEELKQYLLSPPLLHTPKADKQLYLKEKLFCLVYVDDLLVVGTSPTFIISLIGRLQSQFVVRDLGRLSYFLGIEVTWDSSGLHLSQSKKSIHDDTLYRSTVGVLQYLTFTRPDIAFAVNKVSQFIHNPLDSHLVVVKRILRYLKGTLSHGLHFSRQPSTLLHGYRDADWGGSIDNCKSTSGWAIFLGSHLISWASKKQCAVSRSSTEVEYRALANAASELTWLEFLLRKISCFSSFTPVLWCDNLSAIYLTINPVFHSRTKHMEIDFYFVRDKVKNKALSVRYISSNDKIADVLTKEFKGKVDHACQPCSTLGGV
ncbi:uncharacterized mitochondrial protein AtMg00810-like [Nicotiana tomentosiformis]|uniref:uncharacterized mitochondrial protein AtMg00810-like n=1 Tax=Nicotiana tomentosiformis TaxID=4098 RepID=UPI00388C6E84